MKKSEILETRRVTIKKEDLKARTHIEYKRNCDCCSTTYWSRKITGKFCSSACRSLNRRKIS